jgi:hypothetical protein
MDIAPYTVRDIPSTVRKLMVITVISGFTPEDAVEVVSKASPGSTILVCYGEKKDQENLEHCKFCFRGMTGIVYTDMYNAEVIFGDKIYPMQSSIGGTTGPYTIGDPEIHTAALALTGNDYRVYSVYGDLKAWLERHGISP